MSSMLAVVRYDYGTPDTLALEQVDRPQISADEVLVRVRAASLNPVDGHFLTGLPYVVRLATGVRRPRRAVLGADVAGTVEAVGQGVTRFRPGDDVFGMARGSFAEYACAGEDSLAAKPEGVSFEEAAAAPIAGLTALQALRDHGHLGAKQHVLLNGATGGVGTFAVQVAKTLGAEVTGVCSTSKVDLVRSLGADHVVDYNREDFTRGGPRFAVLLDSIGNRSLADCRRVLEPDGTYVMVGGPKQNRVVGPLTRMIAICVVFRSGRPKGAIMLARPKAADLETLGGLMADGRVAPVIEQTYPLSRAREAFQHLERGHLRGKLVITL